MAKKPDSSINTNMHALLIAVDCYLPNQLPDGSYPSLAGCVRDVKHVEGFLLGTLKVPAENIVKLTSTDTGGESPPEAPKERPTYENIVSAFGTLARRAARGDQVYIHYHTAQHLLDALAEYGFTLLDLRRKPGPANASMPSSDLFLIARHDQQKIT